VDRKVLSDIAIFDKPAFMKLVEQAKASLAI
jgi:large subunit ribosomal protein L20